MYILIGALLYTHTYAYKYKYKIQVESRLLTYIFLS